MADFRKITPMRRSDVCEVKKYSAYKQLLREDFHQRCGYCGDHEFYSNSFYEIDHFIPITIDKDRENDYSNLVYSCRSCNNSKRAKWPTGDKDKPNNGNEGWIDPCDIEYASQFDRISDGSVMPITKLGQWMWKALSLGNPSHRLKWKLEQLKLVLMQIESLVVEDAEELKKINQFYAQYMRFEEKLKGTPNFL